MIYSFQGFTGSETKYYKYDQHSRNSTTRNTVYFLSDNLSQHKSPAVRSVLLVVQGHRVDKADQSHFRANRLLFE